VVAAEVPEQPSVLIEAKELADQFDGQDLAVVQQRREAALPEVVEVQGGQLVIDQTKDGEHIIIQGHGASPLQTVFSTAFVEESTLA
jgi:hypothetical protein